MSVHEEAQALSPTQHENVCTELTVCVTTYVFYSGKFEDEITRELKHTGAGVVSMVSATKFCGSTDSSAYQIYCRADHWTVPVWTSYRPMLARTQMGVSSSLHWPQLHG
jgi:hypothetical protein